VRVSREFRTAHGTAPSCGEFRDAPMRSLSPRSAPVAPWSVRGMVPWLCPGGGTDLLVAAGVVAAVPTAAAGLNDWSDTAGPETRVGLVHAAVNTTAMSLYLV